MTAVDVLDMEGAPDGLADPFAGAGIDGLVRDAEGHARRHGRRWRP
ncbi:hypothetical protein ABIB38_003993 [Massilia sp. UYP11]